jgi:hypothetical protein
MSLTRPTFDVDNVQGLADLVQDQATALKVLFDKTGADAKTYLVALCDALDALDVQNVKLTGDQSIAGVKTFVEAKGNWTGLLNGAPITATDPGLSSSFNAHVDDIANKKATHHRLSVTDFGEIDLTGAVACDTALQAARDYIAAQAQPSTLIFPAGTYKYSVSPNWAIQDAIIEADGEVRLRYTGTDDAVILQGGAIGTYNITFGKFIVECPSTAKNGLRATLVHHSKISAKIMGAGVGYAGFKTEGCVLSLFDVTVSNNEESGFYNGATPPIGLHCTAYLTVPTSYCTFINPILEGVPIGAYLENALGNNFFGGTMEGCTDVGCQIGTSGRLNKFHCVDFESNTNSDINCNGHDNTFFSCDTEDLVIFDLNSYQNSSIDGSHSQINIASGAVGNTINSTRYNRFNTSKTINDLGTKTRLSNNYNVGLTRQENSPPTRTVLTPGASPYTYTNTSGNSENILITAGTITNIQYIKAGVGDLTPTTSDYFILEPADILIITYTSIPAMIRYST